jgi:hypothetical protein
MQTKISLFISISICTLLLNGCIIFPVPAGISDTSRIITSESIKTAVAVGSRDQSVPERIRIFKGNMIVISFKNDVCPCVGKRYLSMKVSEVDSKGVKGYEKVADGITDYGSWVDRQVDPALCKTFATAYEIIAEAENSSILGSNFYPPSYNLIWEAQQAMNPLECDSIRAKILAEKAKQIAEDEGAKPLGYDITGTWLSKITSNHSDFFNKKEQRNLKLIIDEHGNQITATDSSGKATLEAYRIEGFQYKSEIKFKFSSPLISVNQLEGEWKVIDGLTIQGSWHDPIGTASGEWNLRKVEQGIKAQKFDKKIYKHLRNWLSQKPPLEIKWEEIGFITVWTKKVDWMLCAGFIFGGGGCN